MWVGCGDDIYILECFKKGHIRIEPVKDSEGVYEQVWSHRMTETIPDATYYTARFNPAAIDRETASSFGVSPYYRSRPILTTPLLAEALRGCDTYVEKTVMKGSIVQG